MIVKNKAALGLAVAMLFTLGAATSAAEEHLLRWNFNEGDVITYKTVNSTTQEQMGMKSVTEQVQHTDWTVLKVDGEKAVLEMKITRIQASSKNPMAGETKFDSSQEKDRESKDPQTAPYRVMAGKKFTVTLDTRGRVLEVKGYAQLGKELLKMLEEQAENEMALGMMKKYFESMFTDEFMRKTMEQSITLFPDAAVETGASWEGEADFSIPMMGNLKSTMKNTLQGVDGGMATVKIAGDLEFVKEDAGEADPNDQMAAMMRMMKITGGKLEGTLQFDQAKGLIKKKEQRTTMTMEMMGQKMPFTQDQSLELVGVKSRE